MSNTMAIGSSLAAPATLAPEHAAHDWSSFGDRPMTWAEQGHRDPRVSNLQAWLGKLAALAFSVGFFVGVIAVVRLVLHTVG